MILVIDDDYQFATILKHKLLRYYDSNKIKILTDFDYEFLVNNDIEILFLAMELNGKDGVALINEYRNQEDDKLDVVFISPYDGFDYFVYIKYPVYYITKMDLEDDLAKCIKELKQKNEGKRSEIIIDDKLGKITDVMYIKLRLNHAYYYTKDNKKYKKKNNFSLINTELKKYNFVRCHLLYMINVKYIKGIDDKQVFLENNIIIPVSKAYRDEVFKEYRKYRFE